MAGGARCDRQSGCNAVFVLARLKVEGFVVVVVVVVEVVVVGVDCGKRQTNGSVQWAVVLMV